MTVTHLVLSLDPGGLERVVLSLVHQGVRLGQRVSVICVERPGTLAGQVEAAGATVYCADKLPGLRWATVARLQRLLERIQPDVVHTHQVGALFYGGTA